ncbi:PD-(D/E)XK nuclease-like domain-containing protein [Actinomyces urogenitalis]|uniref:PD-(D/E)XK nuclease-like domain-containing protein n=1 Tax=Actinomyces urogenitalis TaxID=103621 RepID=UPI002430C6FB|nr:PD-(D/E)XK nuclease-like domain-containing protein [Actinomyces urogenitalis]MCI7457614.1 PD-(D/E)XK nuclease-like domain-containing protein [Actinomyces urogenitalis]
MAEFEPGIFDGVDEADYHARRFGPAESLSSTEAKRVLAAPALFRFERTHTRAPKAQFDLGHVAHALVLGVGLDLYVHDFDSLRTKAAREAIAEARAAGMVPVSRAEHAQMTALADAVLTHPVAGRLLSIGKPEQSCYAVDEATGTWMRGRLDWLTVRKGQPVIVDLKTTTSAAPADFRRSVRAWGYDLQREWYRCIYESVTGEEADFIHVVVEKTEPYLVSVIRLGEEHVERGRRKMRRALDTYAGCLASGQWPGYTTGVLDLDAA